MPLETLIPNEWERQRLFIKLGMAAFFALAVLWVACIPRRHTASNLRQAQRGMQTLNEQIVAFRAKNGHLPHFKPMRLVASKIGVMSDANGLTLTAPDPTDLPQATHDPFTSAAGSQPYVYYCTSNPPERWLIASAGPDGVFQINESTFIAFNNTGNDAVNKARYDRDKGLSSPGDVILLGP